MYLTTQIERAQEEIKNGLKQKAVNRLLDVINTMPESIEARGHLALLYYESGFLDAAGKYWILTPTTQDHIKKCVAVYEQSVNYSASQILRELRFRGDSTKLSLYAQNKLAQLEADSKNKSRKKYNQRINQTPAEESFKDKLIGKSCMVITLLLIALIISAAVGVLQFLKDYFF